MVKVLPERTHPFSQRNAKHTRMSVHLQSKIVDEKSSVLFLGSCVNKDSENIFYL